MDPSERAGLLSDKILDLLRAECPEPSVAMAACIMTAGVVATAIGVPREVAHKTMRILVDSHYDVFEARAPVAYSRTN